MSHENPATIDEHPAGAGVPPEPAATQRRWYEMSVDAVAAALDVDPRTGLDGTEVARRSSRFGPNRLAEPPRRPRWRRFLDQFRSAIVLILVGAAALAGVIGDLKDTVVIGVVLVINAVLGYIQEGRAENALDTLAKMLVATARVRRDGHVEELPAEALVPGDVVLLEAGDRVPADGRLIQTVTVAIDESALTGEAVPVDKDAGAVLPEGEDFSLGDRTNLAFMNTTVVRGRAELLVTETGMNTEMGKVAELLARTDPSPTPLQVQLDKLGTRLAIVALVAVSAVLALRLAQGEALGEAVLNAIALAVAAIPEGLPAVVTVTLAVGVAQMAKRNAIVKRLHSVETLGSTSVICSDKTGTLTLNRMSARSLVVGDDEIDLRGGADDHDRSVGAGRPSAPAIDRALTAAVLCADAEVRDGIPVGDPTEVALVVMAQQAGMDVDAERQGAPRIAEIPFDSANKYMATFHRSTGDDRITVHVKGAPDVLVERCTQVLAPDNGDRGVEPLDAARRLAVTTTNERLSSRGLRVLAVASGHLPPATVLDDEVDAADLASHLHDLTLACLVGIVDPARPEAGDAIDRCRTAGIGVKLITGDHAATAAAIAHELGIEGRVVTGRDLDAMDDDELAATIDEIGVCARVSPTHKVRVVDALQSNGRVVAMTGDGVNDAAALRRADIGVAMGITGTAVTKEAGDMVLADDNFATIVVAVERGRTIYDNIVKFVRFQLSTNLGAITTILAASLLGMPNPFTAIQVLWVNIICDGPPAMTLGVDPPARDTMNRPPRPPDEAILPARRLVHLLFFGAIMAIGTLGLSAWAQSRWGAAVAGTMAFTTFVFFQLFNVFNARAEHTSALSRDSLTNRNLWLAVGGIAVLQVMAVRLPVLEGVFDTADLTAGQLALCVAVASTVLIGEEIRKLIVRMLVSRRGTDPARGAAREHTAHRARRWEQAAIEAEMATGRAEETTEEAKRHLVLRLARITLGLAVVGVGLALLVLPGPGLVVVAAGLALLSRDVPFARRLLHRVRERLPEGDDGEVSKAFIGASLAVAAVAMSASIWWTFLR